MLLLLAVHWRRFRSTGRARETRASRRRVARRCRRALVVNEISFGGIQVSRRLIGSAGSQRCDCLAATSGPLMLIFNANLNCSRWSGGNLLLILRVALKRRLVRRRVSGCVYVAPKVFLFVGAVLGRARVAKSCGARPVDEQEAGNREENDNHSYAERRVGIGEKT